MWTWETFVIIVAAFLKKYLFIYFERERTSMEGAEGEQERERERVPGRLCIVNKELHAGLDLTNCEIMI